MNKMILESIKSKYCLEILLKRKTLEIRKNRPKIDVPFKCYIYCTKGSPYLNSQNGFFYLEDKDVLGGRGPGLYQRYSGNIIGEFICDRIIEFESEFVDDDCYESIAIICRDEEGDVSGFIEWSNDGDLPYERTDFFKKSVFHILN